MWPEELAPRRARARSCAKAPRTRTLAAAREMRRSIATVCTMCRTARPPGGLLCAHGLWHRLHLPPRGTRVCISLGCRSAERAELQLERRRRCKRQLEHRAQRRAVLGDHLPAQSRRRCGRGEPSPGADVAAGREPRQPIGTWHAAFRACDVHHQCSAQRKACNASSALSDVPIFEVSS